MAQPRIVIVDGGFGGLAAAKALKKSPAEVIHSISARAV